MAAPSPPPRGLPLLGDPLWGSCETEPSRSKGEIGRYEWMLGAHLVNAIGISASGTAPPRRVKSQQALRSPEPKAKVLVLLEKLPLILLTARLHPSHNLASRKLSVSNGTRGYNAP